MILMPTRNRPKARGNESQVSDELIARINTESIQNVILILERNGKELLLYCTSNPEKLKIKSTEGFTIADTIASYAPTNVVKLLLDTAKTNDPVKKIIAETHELEGGIEVETFALAIATLRNRHEDTMPYTQLAKEIRVAISN